MRGIIFPARASIATLMRRNHDSDSVPVKVCSVERSSRLVKSEPEQEKFQRLAAA